MSAGVEIISLEDRARWVAEHRINGLPSQSWEYSWALAASGINAKLAVVEAAGARMLMPFFEREWQGTKDIATIPALSGASVGSNAAPLLLWTEYARSQRWVAGYIQLSPYDEFTHHVPDTEIVSRQDVFFLHLDEGARSLVENASRTVQRKIAAADKRAVVIVEEREVLVGALQRLYPATMRSLNAEPPFDFRSETLKRWAQNPEALILGAQIDNAIAAVYLFQVAGCAAESQLLGYTAEGREFIAWLIRSGVKRLHERGVTTLNLGGGVRRDDGVYRFKQRFNGTRRPLYAAHQIYDLAAYSELCRQAGKTATERWFPAYRARS